MFTSLSFADIYAEEYERLIEVNHCHGPGRGHPCTGGSGKKAVASLSAEEQSAYAAQRPMADKLKQMASKLSTRNNWGGERATWGPDKGSGRDSYRDEPTENPADIQRRLKAKPSAAYDQVWKGRALVRVPAGSQRLGVLPKYHLTPAEAKAADKGKRRRSWGA